MKQRKTEIMWDNVKVREKRRKKAFIEEVKTFMPNATSMSANSTPALSRKSSHSSTTHK